MAADQAPVRVLLVDDSEVSRSIMCAVVAATPGFEVVGDASSAREALALVEVLGPDLVLLDQHMPDPDGLATAVEIRRRHSDVVVLVLTEGPKTRLIDPWLRVEGKRDLSPPWLAEFWLRHGIVRRG